MTLTQAHSKFKEAKCPEDIFDGVVTMDDLKEIFRTLSMLVHPDKNPRSKTKANEAFALLGNWRDRAEQKLKEGTYGDRSAIEPVVVTTKKTTYTLKRHLASADICNVYAGVDKDGKPVLAKVTRSPANNSMMLNEQQVLDYLWNDAPKKTSKAMCHIPEMVDSFELASGKIKKRVNVFMLKEGYVSLAEVMTAYPDGIDMRDAAWMLNRLLGALLVAHIAEVVHGAVLPENYIIHPEKHNGILINWAYAKRGWKPLTVISATNKDAYPPEVFNKPVKSSRGIDVYMAALMIKRLIGKNWPTVAPRIQGLFKACWLGPAHRTKDVWVLFTEFKELLEKIYGSRKYRKFEMPAK